ncbi:Putative large ribosomal subunit protein mL49 [Colletotrichum destructivum]|uniref:Large ribosomal subunit protein mL49 n=1 Tax=Colletotrichum destructivum TaxID=34406 RepID=A0AAX4IQP7_9PEZI|nr:Putative large ribosomal subunit protein mL49 [Colletotrichum destructivum]
MRSALTTAAAVLARSTPRASALLPSIRFSSSASTTSAPAAAARPYVIGLTAGNQFPVYPSTKAAGSSKFTVVKKIEGNKKAFAQDLAREAGFPAEDVKLNPVTGHVQIKGFHVDKVKQWLSTTMGKSAAAA